MYLLPGLKRLCGRSLAQLLDEDSVVGVWRVAKLFRLARLEDQCTEYMAKVIEKVGWGMVAGGRERGWVSVNPC
jgi:ankyrin repeat/BTB/POZ domain-containing protein 1